jgi:hypothetical protein
LLLNDADIHVGSGSLLDESSMAADDKDPYIKELSVQQTTSEEDLKIGPGEQPSANGK